MLNDSGNVSVSESRPSDLSVQNSPNPTWLGRYFPWSVVKKLPDYNERETILARVSTEFSPFCLPGAPQFQEYLSQRTDCLQVQEPIDSQLPYNEIQLIDGEEYHVSWKAWKIYMRGSHLGTYFAGSNENTSTGENNYKRRYEGRIPGRINQGVVDWNREKAWMNSWGEPQLPKKSAHGETVSLVFGYRELLFPNSTLSRTVFERFDEHKDIPFP